MNSNKIVSGIILIGLGIIFLLINMGYISENFIWKIFDLWPLVLILVGINIISKKNPWISIATWVLLFGIVIAYGVMLEKPDDTFGVSQDKSIIYEKLDETVEGRLKLTLGGAEVKVKDTEHYLMQADMKIPDIKHDINYNGNHEKVNISLVSSKNRWRHFARIEENNYDLSLNKQIIWDMDVKMGAVSGTIDLSGLKVSDFDLDVGAGNLELLFGNLYDHTKVSIEGGATKIDITVPEGVGVKVRSQGGLSQTDLQGEGWTNKNHYYVTANYENAEKKIDLDITMGVGKVNVMIK